ncbi:MAG: hypothetical protein QOF30_3003 [Acidimicrobiaceae bacterium]|nr:hypothetical protein [Acidimicrobiaceae bacterium]
MDLPSLALTTGSTCGNDHLVEFYENESFMVDTVTAFLGPALREGDVAIVVATASHRQSFETGISKAGIDVDAAVRGGRYLAFDAADLLSRFMVGGRLAPGAFRETIGSVIEGAARGGRRIQVYGEMVALLWANGDEEAALGLGDLWNQLQQSRSFALLSAYPMSAFDRETNAAAFKHICDQHTMVIPSEGYSLVVGPAEQSRAVAQLQQQRDALQTEVRRLEGFQNGDIPLALREDAPGEQRDLAVDRRDLAVDRRYLAVDRRDWAGNRRDEAGIRRDYAGDLRDHAADQRDQAADERDQAADQRDQAAERSESSITPTGKTGPRNESALARRQAAADRRRASQDRGAGASERTEAELDRDTALADRGASAREREHASHDDLTGAYLRGAGFVELERDIGRARRDRQPLVLVFADVDGLKVINDVHGHAAGDRTLLAVASALRAKLRPHDLIIRYGGDEFVCAISGAKTADARERLALVNAALADGPEHGSISVGLAELLPFDSAGDLVARADAALYRQRRRTRSTRPAMAGVPS